ncbi:type II toxin-antitoxin system VapC family toxin [Streptococcus sinensis]|uniref:type II toxin-antitoxin system VapC family toxin n=1 Tax=Streptococcus sinensis TaxID=176090 RepID=UPI00272C11BE|nr:PIN domain-containing protein [Streptococcus sinensis]
MLNPNFIKASINKLNLRQPTRDVLVDTNVLLDLFSGENKYRYDKFWEYSLENNITLYVTTLTISEYINRKCRTAYEVYRDNLCDREEKGESIDDVEFEYKRGFQKTSEYTNVLNDSLKQVRIILNDVQLIDIEYDELKNIEPSNYNLKDFNDAIFYHLATKNSFGIVTHDRDFLESPSPLIVYTNLN